MKKIILMLFSLIFVTGCSAVYEINIKNDSINEKLRVIETNSQIFDVVNDSGWTIRQTFDSMLNNDKFAHEEYKIKSLNTDKQLGIEYTSSNITSILNSSILNQCYTNPVVSVEDNIVTIETGNNFECYEYYDNLSNIEVRLKTNHKVIYSNCDVKENDVYVWKLTEDGNKNIKISYDKSVVYSDYNILFMIFSVIGILMFGFLAFMFLRMNNRNKI